MIKYFNPIIHTSDMDEYASAFHVDVVSRASSRISNLRSGSDDEPGRASPKTINRSSQILPADDPADILVRGMFAVMGGMSMLFKGKDRVEVLNTWSKVAMKGHRRDEIRHAYDDETDERLEYDLGEQAKEIDYKQQVLNTVEVCRTAQHAACTGRGASSARDVPISPSPSLKSMHTADTKAQSDRSSAHSWRISTKRARRASAHAGAYSSSGGATLSLPRCGL